MSANVWFISCMKVPGALHRPIGSTVYSKWPKRVRKAVFSRSSGRMAIWWKPLRRSIDVKKRAPCVRSNSSSMSGSGYLFFTVTSLSAR